MFELNNQNYLYLRFFQKKILQPQIVDRRFRFYQQLQNSMDFLKQKNIKPEISLQEKKSQFRKLFTALQPERNTIRTHQYCPKIEKQPIFGQTIFPSLLKVQSMQSLKQKLCFEKISKKATFEQKEQGLKHILQNYNNLRKEYDKILEASEKKLNRVTQMKQQIEIMKSKLDILKQNEEQSSLKIINLNQHLQETHQKQQDALMTKKTLENILHRMNKDKVLYKIRDYNLALMLKNKQNEAHMKQQQDIYSSDEYQKVLTVRNKLIKQFNLNQSSRQNKIELYGAQLQNLQEKQRQSMIRNDISAIDEQYNNPKNIYTKKILMVHQFLNRLLKEKIIRLLTYYQDIQNCYQKIKISTSVTDASVLVNKFFAQQQTYEKLLKSIEILEKRLEACKKKNESLQLNYIKSKNEFFTIEEIGKDQTLNRKQFEKIIEKNIQDEFKIQKINLWIQQNMIKLNLRSHADKKSIHQNFKLLINEINKISKEEFGLDVKKFNTIGIQIKKINHMKTQVEQKEATLRLSTLQQENNLEVEWLNILRTTTKKLYVKKK